MTINVSVKEDCLGKISEQELASEYVCCLIQFIQKRGNSGKSHTALMAGDVGGVNYF